MSTPANKVTKDDPAADVQAPGQEAFVTPDISHPGDDVSPVDSQTQFGGDIDWDDALDDGPSERVVEQEDLPPAAKPFEDEPAATAEDEVPSEEEPSSAPISDEEAAKAVADDDAEFQPGEIQELTPEQKSSQEENWEETYGAAKTAAIMEIEKRYQMSEAERDEMQLNPEKVLPGLAARVYVDVFESVLAAVNEMLPVRVTQLNQTSLQAAERTQQFYEAWPGLKTQEGHEKVLAIGRVYKQVNPDAKPEDFIRDVGTQASVALGVPIPGITEVTKDESPTQPHRPAGPGTVAPPPATPVDPRESPNQFTQLNASWDDDD